MSAKKNSAKNIEFSPYTVSYTVKKNAEGTGETERRMKFFIKNLLSKCNQTSSFLPSRSHLLRKCLTENFIFCAVSLKEKTLNTTRSSHEYMKTITLIH